MATTLSRRSQKKSRTLEELLRTRRWLLVEPWRIPPARLTRVGAGSAFLAFLTQALLAPNESAESKTVP